MSKVLDFITTDLHESLTHHPNDNENLILAVVKQSFEVDRELVQSDQQKAGVRGRRSRTDHKFKP